MASLTIDSVNHDKGTGRVYVRYTEGGTTFEREFASVAAMRAFANDVPQQTEFLLKTLIGTQVRTDDVSRIEKASAIFDMTAAQPLAIDTSRVKPAEVIRG